MERTDGSRLYTVIFLVLAALGVGYVCYRVLAPFLAAIAWAIILAVAFQSPWAYLERRMPTRRNLAAALLTLAVACIVLLPAGVFVGVLASQTIDVANRVTSKLSDLHVSSFSDVVALPKVADALDGLRSRAGISSPISRSWRAGSSPRRPRPRLGSAASWSSGCSTPSSPSCWSSSSSSSSSRTGARWPRRRSTCCPPTPTGAGA